MSNASTATGGHISITTPDTFVSIPVSRYRGLIHKGEGHALIVDFGEEPIHLGSLADPEALVDAIIEANQMDSHEKYWEG